MVHYHPSRSGSSFELFEGDKRQAAIKARHIDLRDRGCARLRRRFGHLRLAGQDGNLAIEATPVGRGHYEISATSSPATAELVVTQERTTARPAIQLTKKVTARRGELRVAGEIVATVEVLKTHTIRSFADAQRHQAGLYGSVIYTDEVPIEVVAVCVAVTLGRWLRARHRTGQWTKATEPSWAGGDA